MGLLDSLEPKRRMTPCRVRTVLSELDEKDVEKLTAALADEKGWPHYTLSKTLRPMGVLISADAITRHRTGVCSCSKG